MYFDFPYSIDTLIVESFMAEYPPEWFYVQQNELFLDVAEYQTLFTQPCSPGTLQTGGRVHGLSGGQTERATGVQGPNCG